MLPYASRATVVGAFMVALSFSGVAGAIAPDPEIVKTSAPFKGEDAGTGSPLASSEVKGVETSAPEQTSNAFTSDAQSEEAPQAPGSAPVTAEVPALAETPAAAPAASLFSSLSFDFHGYYRARYVNLNNVPTARTEMRCMGGDCWPARSSEGETHFSRDDASDGSFFYNRLRLEPSLRLGGDPAKGVMPHVALHAQLDLLDTVMWGDNARDAAVPLFATNPSLTGIDGSERPALLVRRLWLEVPVGIGVVRVGRQASHGGLGILFNDGNGFRNEFGDADGGSSFDRVLFATRPLTIMNALTKGDRRETPLLLIAGHDRLVEDQLGFGSNASKVESRFDGGPFGFLTDPVCGGEQAPQGEARSRKCDTSVTQWIAGLIWRDDALNLRSPTDELTLGAIYVNRLQAFSDSSMHIIDGFWRFKLGLWGDVSLLTEGEAAMIRGETRSVKILAGHLDPITGKSTDPLKGDILNAVGRVGLTSASWDGLLELGHSSGDEKLIRGDNRFKMFPMHADYRVGLLMFPVALHARSANTNAGLASDALHGGGGVFNATYLNPKARYRLQGRGHQLEFVAQAVLAWAETLNGGLAENGVAADYYAPRDFDNPWADNRCGFLDPECGLGWELDLAVKFKWLPIKVPGMGANDQYALHWSNEFGVMKAGYALARRLAEGADTLWTLQSRLAFVW